MYSKKIRLFLKDYFTLTSRERKGALALAFLIVIQIFAIVWLNYISSPEEDAIEKYSMQISGFVQRQSTNADANGYSANNIKNETVNQKKIHLWEFDPNVISDSVWIQFGLSKKQTAIVRNYLNKGGAFRKKEDVAKIFGITEHQYRTLEPYIRISEKVVEQNKFVKQFPKTKQAFQKININSADTIELCKLPLIGPGRARMIYKYRIALGGFIDEKQLLEVFTMDSSVLNAIRSQIFIDNTAIQKVNINSDDFKHPYISKQMVYAIKAYRKQHGNFSKIEDLKQLSVMSNELISKLAPYVAFE